MRLVGLISGGKDSIFNMLQCVSAGHEFVAVANIEPNSTEEMDSYMYQSVGHQTISIIASALGLPLFRIKTNGNAICKSKSYSFTAGDEVEDLFTLLTKVKQDLNIEGVSVGAIASDYQRTRVESVCSRLGLKCFAYLWKRNQEELLQEMIDAELDAIIIKVACIGLDPENHLGMHIKDLKPHLEELNKKYGVNVCGEGGEYETLTLDCPLFHRSLKITDSETVTLSNDAFATVAYLNIKNVVLERKESNEDPIYNQRNRISHVKTVIRSPYSFIQDCVDDIAEKTLPQKPVRSVQINLPFPFVHQKIEDDESSASVSVNDSWKLSSVGTGGGGANMTYTSLSSSSLKLLPTSSASSTLSNYSLIYSSGWCCVGNITGATLAEAFSSLKVYLDRIDFQFEDAVFVNLYIRDMAEFSRINQFYQLHISHKFPPARACVQASLPPEISVIVIFIANKLISKSQKVLHKTTSSNKDAVHVQSISHWAPANIGPYSQGRMMGGIYYLAGSIPLIPGSMELLNKPIICQCRLALRHVLRVMQAMNKDLTYSNVLHAICYVTTSAIASDVIPLWHYITKVDHATVTAIVVTALPQNAQIEWEVVACSYDEPEGDGFLETVDEFTLNVKRCVYSSPFASSLVCKVSFAKGSTVTQDSSGKNIRSITEKEISDVLKHCIYYLNKSEKNVSNLCILKVFYKATEKSLAKVLNELRIHIEKVTYTVIPVKECEDQATLFTVTGVCH